MSPEARERWLQGSSRGGHARAAQARTDKADGMARAVEWRESRRCRELVPDPFAANGARECRALGWQLCVHRPGGAE